MKILFLCASLEAGWDGVGDYTTRLAGELRSLGHESWIIAIHDRHLRPNSGLESNFGIVDRPQITSRLSSSAGWRQRIRAIQQAVVEYRPDWVSLQYVPYGFHRKGLPLLLPKRLASLGGWFRWHVMFHELWIDPGADWCSPLVSRLQQAHISNLCGSLCPALVNTSNVSYAKKLALIGIPASLLPLFSNIEKVSPDKFLRQKLVEEILPAVHEGDVWFFLFFGSIHPGWDVDVFLKRISEAARKAGKKAVVLLSIGKNPCQESAPLTGLRKIEPGFLHFREIGEMATSDISQFLQAADFGVATTPLGLLGKSGSAAAMTSHGIPVVVPRADVLIDRDTLDKKGILPVDGLFEEKLLNPPRPCEFDSVGGITRVFLTSLESQVQFQ